MREGHSIARNRALALACRYMHIIDAWGSGIPRIDKLLVSSGLKALDIEDNGIDIRLTVWRKSGAAQVSITTQETTQENSATQEIGERILQLVKSNPKITTVDMARALGLTRDGVNYHLRAMKAKGLLRREGATKNGIWIAMA